MTKPQIVVALAALLSVLLLLKLMAWLKARKPEMEPKWAEPGVEAIRSAWDDVHTYVEGAKDWRPHLTRTRFFWGAVFTSLLTATFAATGGWSLGAGSLFHAAAMALAFLVVNIAQPIIALDGEITHDGKPAERSRARTGALLVLMGLNFFGIFLGSTTIGSQMATSSTIEATGTAELLAKQARDKDEIAKLYKRRMDAGGRSLKELQAIEASASAEERRATAAADEEAKNKYCGPLCKGLQDKAARARKEADTARAEAAAASREESLTKSLADTKAALEARGGFASTEANPAGAMIEALTGGVVTQHGFALLSITLLLSLIAVLDLYLWLRTGEEAAHIRAAEWSRRAEKGNAELVNRGMTARYLLVPSQTALPAPGGPVTNNVTVQVQEDIAGKIRASADLTEIDGVFTDMLAPDEARRITFGLLYGVYRERRKQAGANHLNDVQFFAALKTYCQLKSIRQESSELVGWWLSVAK